MTFSKSQFWNAIDLIDREAVRDAPQESRALAALMTFLESSPITLIEEFERLLRQLLYDIDGEVYCDAAGINSGDGFLYRRCFVVAMGQEYYNSVLVNPKSMPDSEFEPLLYVAAKAWATKTGGDPYDWNLVSSASYETGANSDRWTQTNARFEEMQREWADARQDEVRIAADAAFSARNYEEVVRLLAPIAETLAPMHIKKLEFARKKL